MAWVVDTCVLIDVLEGDARWGVLSARLLDRLTPKGLVVCPVTRNPDDCRGVFPRLEISCPA